MRFRLPVRRRRAVRVGTALGLGVVLVLWVVLHSTAQPYPRGPVTVATGVPDGVYQKYGQLLQGDLRRDLPGVAVRLKPSQGSVQNLEYLASGQADFTFSQADAAADYHGPGATHLRAVARLYDDYMQLVVPAGSKVKSVYDLRGLRVGIGQPGSGVSLIARRLLKAAGLDADRDLTAVPAGVDTAPSLLRSGRLDAFFWSGGLPTLAIQRLAGQYPVKLVPLDDVIKPLHRLGAAADFYRAAVMPPDAYPNVQHGQSVETIAVANLLVTTDRTDPALVQRVTQTVIDSRDSIGAVVHSAQQVDLRTAIFTDPLPLHEGARRYYLSVKP
ncbi:TAXI family TRAP transporter solute-binding subunit [Streptantibioticus rubrisoli]|uniref:TAXI family TRAP transporter solute-binding subunit n=1 Tax=Streptantibioticus rubrisoli TaxID=1387313 RepID=A0ABT1PI64_9ACTN|nr:TAXI family TRAP transporter solute-binding subunit [Streptantibioticus rubrisoli]MCQ4045055.1 TAXI family TRAP transporter solute-binding subunit [Streptantibioticus rubrisoli]